MFNIIHNYKLKAYIGIFITLVTHIKAVIQKEYKHIQTIFYTLGYRVAKI